ncbi:MAG: adenylyltransferase/cytidyltransferase family protein [Flavobacteriales bacterium]|nr:adenylyltransferase/cytidyltransferase family protein [Flavobacteriales bacterium]
MKSYTLEVSLTLIKDWRSKDEKIVFTNGVFDLLHVGHVDYLERAKSMGDRLIVGINDDASVRRLGKAPERPINPEWARAQIIAALKPVDAVIIFGEDTPLRLIESILPDVLVKGGDYNADCTDAADPAYIVGSTEVIRNGGKVKALSLVQGFSTTNIVSILKRTNS